MAQKVEEIMSQKEHVNIIVDGFVFQRPNKHINADLSTAWRCQEKRTIYECTSTCAIDKFGFVSRPPTKHNHDKPAPEKLNAKLMKYNAKKRCREEPHLSVPKVLKEEKAKVIKERKLKVTAALANEAPTTNSFKTSLYAQRNKLHPVVANSVENIILTGQYVETTDGERFLLFDIDIGGGNRIICLASDIQLECLVKSKLWYIDGTFAKSPNKFFQIYIIHAWYLDEMHVCAYIFLRNKTMKTYENMIDNLIKSASKLGFNLQPRVSPLKNRQDFFSHIRFFSKFQMILSDFEQAVLSSFQSKFPGVVMKGCFFHYTQALWKNIVDNGLRKAYKYDTRTRNWLEMFKSLALIPTSMINDAWCLILKYRPHEESNKIQSFINYFHSTWLFGSYPLKLWNHYSTHRSPRTNNHAEGYNSSLSKFFGQDNPNIYVAIENLKVLNNEMCLNYLNRCENNAPPKKRNNLDIAKDFNIARYKINSFLIKSI
jgi:hypothetical protein